MSGIRRLSRAPRPSLRRSTLAACHDSVETLLLAYIAHICKLALVEKTE
jgi:hypothetical protein